MRVTTAAPDAAITDAVASASANANLTDVLEAYQVFCDLGWHHVAWTNLFLSLDGYLVKYFNCNDGNLPITHMSMRIRYLANLTIEQFGDVISDTVYSLLHQAGIGPPKELDTPPRNLLSSVGNTNLHNLLLDLTKELGERSSLSATRARGVWLSSLPKDWSPTHSADWRIAHTLVNLLSVEVSTHDEVLPTAVPPTTDPDAAIRIPSVARRLLRRALSARISTPTRLLSAQRERPPPPPGDFNTPNFSWKLRVKSAQSENKDLRVERKFPTANLLLQSSQRVQEVTVLALRPISQQEEAVSVESRQGSFYQNSVHSSHKSSQTLESLLDLYRRSSQKSVGSSSRRSSIDIGELCRIDNLVSSSNAEMPRDKRFSWLSVTRVSARSDITNITRHSFVTADSQFSYAKRRTRRRSSFDSFHTVATPLTLHEDSQQEGLYHSLLQQRDLVPSPMLETDWSGRGQHVEYEVAEQDQIPLQAEKILGQTRNALVESVKCRRVRLVRKIIRCTRWNGLKLEDALIEVQHLYRVQHAHIVRLVGTYVTGSDLAILTYPCAQWNLEQFMREVPSFPDIEARARSLRQFFTCLAKVLDFMHSFPLKHMDIKPANLLVRDISNSELEGHGPYKIYVTDFGIAKTYPAAEESDTETPTPFTRAYAAQEVVLQESRGLSADIFSLGCVYAEMLAVILDLSMDMPESKCREGLATARGQNEAGVRAYHLSTKEVRSWLTQLDIQEPELDVVREWTYNMIDLDPAQRPSAQHIAHDPQLPFPCVSCTLRTGPEDFEVAEPLLEQPPPL
ncbi:kinase-like domain-containing protein [Lophiotrema nucula]|uniref:Kinase-like domain-containing protein n=1 Tax=Lophiotrema nucula TaxID=690887 RepID=A0A6A5ZJ46_9PLEO|nr:kinase-like domain-containing protein [Lophiotrema nucula]